MSDYDLLLLRVEHQDAEIARLRAKLRELTMSQSGELKELFAALAKAQAEMEPVAFDRKNPHYGNKYASLPAIRNGVKPVHKHGLAILHVIRKNPNGDRELVGILGDGGTGQYIESAYPLPNIAKNQEYGSALTYGTRYTICALTGIVGDEDDDAELADKAPKRANPNVNKAEDFTEHEVQYDGDGNPVDNIPHGNPQLKPLRVVDARKEYTALQSELIAMGTLPALRKWANTPQTKDRVQTLPTEWQAHMRDLFEGKKKELTLAQDSGAKHRPEPADVAAAD